MLAGDGTSLSSPSLPAVAHPPFLSALDSVVPPEVMPLPATTSDPLSHSTIDRVLALTTIPPVVPTKVPLPPAPVHTKSWASVAASSTLSQFSFQTSSIEGNTVVSVPDEIIDDCPLWECFLVGRFAATAPHVAKIHVIVNKIWTLGDKTAKIDVFVVNDTTVKFRISSPLIRKHVLRRGMWNICEIPLIVSKWSPIIEEAQPAITSMPMWIKVKYVPHSMFSWKGLGFLTSPLGKPIRLHQDTLMVTSFDEAKVFVDVNLAAELATSRTFLIKGQQVRVEYEYLRLPPRCGVCGKWGHLASVCLATKPPTPRASPVSSPASSPASYGPSSSSLPPQVSHSLAPTEGAQPVGVPNNVTTSSSKDLFSAKSGLAVSAVVHTDAESETLVSPQGVSPPTQVEIEEGEIHPADDILQGPEKAWSTVSSHNSKSATKSPPALVYGQVSIASPSRYAILSTLEEGIAPEDTADVRTSEDIQPPSKPLEESPLPPSGDAPDLPPAPRREPLPRSTKKQARAHLAGKLNPKELLPGTKAKRSTRKH